MSVFDKALEFTLKWEGGYSNNPNDPGGATMKGVIQKTYDDYRKSKGLPLQGVKAISDSEVHDIYENLYWKASGCDKIADSDLAISVFDFACNAGVGRAIRYLALTKDHNVFNKNRSEYYNKIATNNPKLKVFLKGWLNRVRDLTKYLESI